MGPNPIDEEEMQRYLEAKMKPQFYEQPDAILESADAIRGSQETANLANMAKGFEQASASFSGGRYKPNTEYLDDFGKTAQGMAGNAEKRLVNGQQQAGQDRKAAIGEYLAGKKQSDNLAFQQKRLNADNQYRQDNLDAQSLNRKEAREQRTFLAGERAADRKAIQDHKDEEKNQALQTPYGLANSVDDAKRLKEAHESKSSFDNKIDQMIALRQKHDGGAVLDREDVATGKRLSKELLLEYKNLARLGVLSVSDENILNQIIPSDPLEYKMAGIVGQDPILSNLKGFKKDSQKDFDTKVGTRTREGLAGAGKKIERKVVDRQVNPQQPGKMKLVYSDGSEEIVDTGKVANSGASGEY